MFPLLDQLISNPLAFFEEALYRVPAVLIALIFHELAHGYVAYRLGDPTAKMMGRLTLNPLKHLDPLGTIMMFFLGFGWAKPVPVNPNNFKKPRRDDFLVSIAGITMNLILFVVFFAAYFFVWRSQMAIMMAGNFWYTILPYLLRILSYILQVNLSFAIFNLLPVPPLDGSHIANDLVHVIGRGIANLLRKRNPDRAWRIDNWLLRNNLFASGRTQQIGMALLLVLSFTGWLGRGMSVVSGAMIDGIFSLFISIFGL